MSRDSGPPTEEVMTPKVWFLVVAPEPEAAVPLGLANLVWPWSVEPNDPRWEDGACWHPVSALDVEDHWSALVTDEDAARRHLSCARGAGPATLLQVSLSALPDAIGWDIGPASGGYSCARHELPSPLFHAQRAAWSNANGLFRSREAARAFWAEREALATEHSDGEEPSGWSLVCLVELEEG